MTPAPEDRIREHLERRGGSTEVELLRLLRTWGADGETAEDRELVAGALERAGIAVSPDVRTAPPGTTIRLELAAAAPTGGRPGRPTPPSGRRARERPAPEATPAAEELEPVEIPDALPRMLVTGGAIVLMVSLFLPWFTALRGGVAIDELSSGWQWLSVLDVFLAAIAVGAVTQLATDAFEELGARAVAIAAIVGMAAVTARIVSPPNDILESFTVEVGRKLGPFVALLALGLIVAGAALRTSPSLSRGGTVLPDGQAPDTASN